jgi:DNA invertase Pin-like site-specific DNA recombinase
MYLRKSRADDSSMTVDEVLAKHESILQEYAINTFGAPIPESQIIKEVVSGETIKERPGIRKVLDLITTQNISGVLCADCSRLSRGDLKDCGHIIRCFQFSNTKIITPKHTYFLADDSDRTLFKMELEQGNYYLEYVKMVQKRGKEAAVKSGQFIGNNPPYGYNKITIDKKKTLTPNDKAPIVKFIFEMAAQGKSPYFIAKELNEKGIKPIYSNYWSNKSIYKILMNVHYLGKIKWYERKTTSFVDSEGNIQKKRVDGDPLIIEGLHPAIVDENLFSAVQDYLGLHTRKRPQTRFASPYASLVKCGVCGKAISYQAYAGRKQPRMACRGKQCACRSISFKEFNEGVISALKSVITDFNIEVKNNTNGNESALIQSLNAELIALKRKELKVYDYLEDGTYTKEVFNARISKYESEKERLEKALIEAESKQKKAETAEEFTISVYEAIDSLNDNEISAESKNKLLKRLIDKIEFIRIDDEEPEIKIFFK